MPEFETSIDIDIDDFISECNSREIKDLIEFLVEDGYLPESILTDTPKIENTYWNQEVQKLTDNQWKLSVEDEQTILNITKKLF